MEEKVHEKGNFVAVENMGTVVVAVYTGQVICVHGSAEGPKEKEREIEREREGISFQKPNASPVLRFPSKRSGYKAGSI